LGFETLLLVMAGFSAATAFVVLWLPSESALTTDAQ
jgi:hypothetical protein